MTSSHIFHAASSISLPAAAPENASLSLRDTLFFLRMRWPWIILTTAVFMAAACAYLLTAAPTFVASTQLLVSAQVDGSDAQRSFAEDTFLEAQLEIAKSSDVLGATAAALNLGDDPAFADTPPSLQERAKAWLTATVRQDGTSATGEPSADVQKSDRVISRLRNVVALRRIGRSTILEVSASAASPEKAVAIADTVAKQYILKNIQMKAQAARQYSEWLERFVADQQRGLTDAANALASFKSNPSDQFKLAELQSTAEARSTLFENTLRQYAEAKQRISYPVSDASIVSPATTPLAKAMPRSGLILAFATAVGLGAGFMLAMIRHAGDRRIIRAQRLAETARLPFVTFLARSRITRSGRAIRLPSNGSGSTSASFPVLPGMEELGATIVGLRRRRRAVIGIVAVDPGSGASTIACELAALSAASGSRTLLIDAAAKKPSLSGMIAPHASAGLTDVLDNAGLMQTAALPLTPTLRFLPLGTGRGASPAIRLSSRRTQMNFEDLKKEFDAIFVDISAFSVSPDANAIAPELDGVLVVTCYGRTSIDDTVRVIDGLRNVGAEILGAIINKSPAGMQL